MYQDQVRQIMRKNLDRPRPAVLTMRREMVDRLGPEIDWRGFRWSWKSTERDDGNVDVALYNPRRTQDYDWPG